MGRTSPLILRSGHLFNNWKSHWFSDINYTSLLSEDLKVRYYINNVNYYLKLPSSDLKIRRPQNQVGVMYSSYYIPEYLRVNKVNTYKFKFFRYQQSGLNSISIHILNNNPSSSSNFFNYIVLSKLLTYTTTEFNPILNTIKHYLILTAVKIHSISAIDTNYVNNLTKNINTFKLNHYVLTYKYLCNFHFNLSSYLNKLKFKKSVIGKLFNKKYNLTTLFELFSAEDIVMRDAGLEARGKSIIYETRRKMYTATSIVLSDSFGKLYEYNPQKTRRKYPFYDFFYFFKLNLVDLLKTYTNLVSFRRRQRKRRLLSKKLRRKYFIRYAAKVISYVKKFKLLLGNLVHNSNNIKFLIKNIRLKLKTNLNRYSMNSQSLLLNQGTNSIKSSKSKPNLKKYLMSFIYDYYLNRNNKVKYANNLFENIGIFPYHYARYRHRKPKRIYKKKMLKHILKAFQNISQQRGSFKLPLGPLFFKTIVPSRYHLINNLKLQETNKTFHNSVYSTYKFFKDTYKTLNLVKCKVYELLDYYWVKLSLLYKFIISKFRRIQLLKKKYYKNFKRSQVLSEVFSHQWMYSILHSNLGKNVPLYSYIESKNNNYILHPIFKWVGGLMKINHAYKNKMNHMNRYFLSNKNLLSRLAKAPYYFLKLRRKKRRKIDKLDIRYIPREWHKTLLTPERTKEQIKEKYLRIKKHRKYSRSLNKFNDIKKYQRLLSRLTGTKRTLNASIKYQTLMLSLLKKEERYKIKSRLLIRTILKYFQKLMRIKHFTTRKFIKLLRKVELKNRRSFKARERRLNHLYYVRWLSKTLRESYPIYYRTVLFLIKPRIIKRFRKALRDPKFYYDRKKKKLPFSFSLKRFKKLLNLKNNKIQNRFKLRQWKHNRYGNKFKRKNNNYNFDAQLRHRRMSYYRSKRTKITLAFYKKMTLQNILDTTIYRGDQFHKKLVNMFMTNNNSRFVILNNNTRILNKYLLVLRKLYEQIIFNNSNLRRKNFSNFRKKNHYVFKKSYQYELKRKNLMAQLKSTFTQRSEKDKLSHYKKMITIGYILNYLKKHIINIVDPSLITTLLKTKNLPSTKSKSLFLTLYLLKVAIQNNLFYLPYKRFAYINQLNKSPKSNASIIPSQAKIHRSYYNYKVRSKSRILRMRHQYKNTVNYFTLENNKLVNSLGYLKRFMNKLSMSLKKLFNNQLVNNNYNYNYYTTLKSKRSYNKFLRQKFKKNGVYTLQNLTENKNNPMFVTDSYKVKNQPDLLKRKYLTKLVNKIANKKSKRNFIRKYLTSSLNKVTLSKIKSIKYKSYMLSNLRIYFNNLLFMYIKSLPYKDKLNRRQNLDISRIKSKYNVVNTNRLLPKNRELVQLSHTSRQLIKKMRKIHSNEVKQTSYTHVLYGNSVYKYSTNKINIFRYLNNLSSIFSNLFNQLFQKLNILIKTTNLKSSKVYNLYRLYYHFIYNKFYLITKITNTIVVYTTKYIMSSFYKKIYHFISKYLLMKSVDILEGSVKSIKYNSFKRYTYFDMNIQRIMLMLKKGYGYNLTSQLSDENKMQHDLYNTEYIINDDSSNKPLTSLHNIGNYLDEDMMNYLQLNYVMEYDTNKLVHSKENFLYFYNIYTYNYDYNCMYILNPRLLCEYFVYAIKNKVQYYEVYNDIKESFSDLRRLQINLKKAYDRILYRILHGYLDCLTDWYFLNYKEWSSYDIETALFFKKLKSLSLLFTYLIYLVDTRNYINICGLHIKTGGRRSRKLRTHTRLYQRGKMSLNTFADNIDYYFKPVISRFGILGTKIFVYRESCFRIPLLHIMYQTLFLRFKLFRLLITQNNDAKY